MIKKMTRHFLGCLLTSIGLHGFFIFLIYGVPKLSKPLPKIDISPIPVEMVYMSEVEKLSDQTPLARSETVPISNPQKAKNAPYPSSVKSDLKKLSTDMPQKKIPKKNEKLSSDQKALPLQAPHTDQKNSKKQIVKKQSPKNLDTILRKLSSEKSPSTGIDMLLKNLQKKDPSIPSNQGDSHNKDKLASSSPLSPDAFQDLRQQLKQCWHIPAGARDAENLIVIVQAEIAPDGTVKKAKIMPHSSTNPFYKIASEAALRALSHPLCVPLKLPLEHYESWKVLELVFNPKI